MNRLATAAFCLALAVATFYQFPGHTWLAQDTQIYVPILEHLRDPAVLRNDMLAQQPHVAYTLYDETARLLRGATGLGFREALEFQQVALRALGIWGLYLMATALGLPAAAAMLVASIGALGASIAGPQVLTFEYEPTPRAFAVLLLMCAVGLAAHRRLLGAGIAAGCAFLYHPPTALPFWVLFAALVWGPSGSVARRGRWRSTTPLAAAALILLIASRLQAGEGQVLWGRLPAIEEQLQRFRAPYVWISTWPAALILHHLLVFAIGVAAYTRIRHKIPFELRVFLLGLPLVGVLSMPLSWLLLEHGKWALLPQVQPLRNLLFGALAMQFLTAAAGALAALGRRPLESAGWFALAYLLPLQPTLTDPFAWRRTAVAAGLALVAAGALRISERRNWRMAPALGVAAMFAIPGIGGVANYPRLATPELTQLSQWARASTPQDAVFLFPDAARSLDPGVFRSEALRAVYVDWKAGGQVNYLRGFGDQWWFRWRQTMAGGRAVEARPADFAKYDALGIRYIVLKPQHRLARPAAFENASYVVYPTR
jgi:hypothetical protein